ncbi:MAG: Rieske (2Fe-2S) protein, partial [Actinobacteria bacterium]|nr:Rieske (2Fe-2S) protein [Actinomycetota bacterium]
MRKTIGIAVAAAALLVACGSDDNDAAPEAPTTEAPMTT